MTVQPNNKTIKQPCQACLFNYMQAPEKRKETEKGQKGISITPKLETTP
jgi:hypothetical protein